MKTIYITENMVNVLKESILMDSLPVDVMDAVYKNKTSLGNNPALPNIFEEGYLEKIVKKSFEQAKDELKKIGEISDFPDNKIETVLAKLINKCKTLEAQNRQELEKICYNYVVNLFSIPEDTVQLDLKLVDNVDMDGEVIQLDPIYDEEAEYEDIIEANSIKDEIYKRRMLNVLSMGAGMKISSNIKSYISDIYDINPQLCDLYRKIIALNNYIIFTKEDLHMTDDNKMQLGSVIVNLGHGDEKIRMEAQGVIFPILLSETIRGFMDLFSSHGLPKEKAKMEAVLSKADYLKAEPWDMRLGPALWTILSDSFEDVDTELLPYVYKKIASLSCKNFNKVLSEVFAKTRQGKRLMGKVIEMAREDKDYDGFEDKMGTLKTDKSIITDEYIKEEEL